MKRVYPEFTVKEVDLLANKKGLPSCCFKKEGAILPGFGFVSLGASAFPSITGMYIAGSGEGLMVQENLKVYKINDSSLKDLTYFNNVIADEPTFLEMSRNGKTELVVSGNKTAAILKDGECSFLAGFPAARCAAVCRGRAFVSDFETGYMIKWSGTAGCGDWEEGISGAGYVYLDLAGGPVYDLFAFEGELVALRSRSVSRFAVSGSPETFRLIETIRFGAGITRRTAAVVGDKIIFHTPEGMYYYSKGKIKHMEEGLIDLDAENPVMAAAFKERYYVMIAKSKYFNANVVFFYDSYQEAYSFMNVNAKYIAASGDNFYMFTSSKVYGLKPNPEYAYMCGTFDFGTKGRKLLTELSADFDGNLQVVIDNGRSIRRVYGSVKRLNMRGSEFTVSVACTGAIRSLKLKAEVIKCNSIY